MIVYHEWIRYREKTMELKHYRGWFLFGLIPVYIKTSDWIPW